MAWIRMLSAAAVLVTSAVSSAAPHHGWYPSFEQAQSAAADSEVPLLIHFHASWCGPCRRMEAQVFSSPMIHRALQDGLVAVQVDTGQRGDLSDQFGVETVPRDIVVYPDGTITTLSVGFVPRNSYVDALRDTAARGRSMALAKMQQQAEREQAAQQERAAARRDNLTAESPAETTDRRDPFAAPDPIPVDDVAAGVVGLNGFCPVRLTADREWVKGKKDYSEQYRGVTYRLSSLEERDRFRKDPGRYAPRNLGCDPVMLLAEQKAVTGRIRYGAFFDDQLYLFRTSQTRKEFKSNPLKYTRIQHAIRPSELSGQTFR